MVCEGCRVALPPSSEHTAPQGIAHACAVFEYRFPVDRLVQRFKYEGDLATGRWLAQQLAGRAAALARPDLVVAPPSRPAHLRRRGFNPALEVAKAVARRVGAPCSRDAFAWSRATEAQSSLGGRRRRENLRGAFACRLRLEGRSVWIVDDVLTTGATLAALAVAARAAGAAEICALTVARAAAPPGR